MIKTFQNVRIQGIAAAVPKNIVEIKNLPGLQNADRMMKSTGIERVRVTTQNQTAADLCEAAAKRLFSDLSIQPGEIDGLILVTPTPDHLIPPTSNVLQAKLGLPVASFCIDISCGCSAYAFGLMQASMMLNTGVAKKVLLLVGETLTKSIHPDDLATKVLFGDGGTATLLTSEPGEIKAACFVDGSRNQAIVLPNSGWRKTPEPSFLKMNSHEVFGFTIRDIPIAVKEFLLELGSGPEDFDFFVFHQANQLVLDAIAKKLKLEPAQVLSSLRDLGNTGGASIPVTIVANRASLQPPKTRVLLSGFGGGLSWGVASINLAHTSISPLVEME